MSFYNAYRPTRWSEVLGQDQTIAILKRQAQTGEYHHSYLFFGSSGSGKTTTARILAMTMNCFNLDGTGEPCGECDNCRTIYQGQNWDVFEIDSARNRGIENIKDLAYKAHFSPISKKKVYIFDEVHALTPEAFNSLLKLLEEPPQHLVLILITTDFAKIPETVSSRCQLYPFTRLKPEDIKKKLELICEREGIAPDTKHIQFIVESSAGNLRSAENILEQICKIKEK